MKTTKTIIREAVQTSDEYDYYADAERTGEISRATYYRACVRAGLTRAEALDCLRRNYERAGLGHLV